MTVDTRGLRRVLLIQLAGDLTQKVAERVAGDAQADVLGRAALIVLDLRTVTTLSAGGARTLRDLAVAADRNGAQLRLVVGPSHTLTTVLDTVLDAGSHGLSVPRFTALDSAVNDQLGPAPVPPAQVVTVPAQGLDALVVARTEQLTRTLLDATDVGTALQQVVDAAVLMIPPADLVSVTLRSPAGKFFTPVETDPVATALDQAQYRSGTGPCVDAARADAPGYVSSDDLTTDDRWPQFSAAATRHGYRAVLSNELPAPNGALSGALNIYSRTPAAFTDAHQHAALLLATHASFALAHTQAVRLADLQQAHLRQAIDSRDVIGQAKGILMNRQNISADQAFDLLRRASQELNVKLVDLARTLAARHTDLDGLGGQGTETGTETGRETGTVTGAGSGLV